VDYAKVGQPAQCQIYGEQVMIEFSGYIGLDTHKDTIAEAIADSGRGKPRYYGGHVSAPKTGPFS